VEGRVVLREQRLLEEEEEEEEALALLREVAEEEQRALLPAEAVAGPGEEVHSRQPDELLEPRCFGKCCSLLMKKKKKKEEEEEEGGEEVETGPAAEEDGAPLRMEEAAGQPAVALEQKMSGLVVPRTGEGELVRWVREGRRQSAGLTACGSLGVAEEVSCQLAAEGASRRLRS